MSTQIFLSDMAFYFFLNLIQHCFETIIFTMMKSSIVVVLFLFMYLSNAQQDSLVTLMTNTWSLNKNVHPNYTNWLERDTISLISIQSIRKIKDALTQKEDLSKEDIKYLMSYVRENKERIKFDSIGNIKHLKFIYCPVGATIFNLNQFKLKKGSVQLNYTRHKWSSKEKDFFTFTYKIILWNEDEIILSKIK